MNSYYSQPRRAVTCYKKSRKPQRMFTEGGLLHEAKNFLNGKNLFDGNLRENKQYAYESIQYCKNIDVSQEKDDLNIDIDDELDTHNDDASTVIIEQMRDTGSKRFRSTGFGMNENHESISQARTANGGQLKKTKYKIRSLKS